MTSQLQDEQMQATRAAVLVDQELINRKIKDLEVERDELERINSYLEKRLGRPLDVVPAKEQSPAGPYAALTTADACAAYLRSVGQPERDTNQIIEGIQGGGWTTDAEKPYTTVFGTLNREWKKPNSRFFKLHGRFGLTEWKLDEQKSVEIPGVQLWTSKENK